MSAYNANPTQLIDWFDDFADNEAYQNEYAFLSNFYRAPFLWSDLIWLTAEHAFAYMKIDLNNNDAAMWQRDISMAASPGEAKLLGRSCPLRPDWELIKFDVMHNIVYAKFYKPAMRDLLLSTGEAYLQEGTEWNDQVWGVDRLASDDPWLRPGKNWLGIILMATRARLRVES